MDEPTRRAVLASAVAAAGVTAGCNTFGEGGEVTGTRTSAGGEADGDGGEPNADTVTARDSQVDGEGSGSEFPLYLAESTAGLPGSPGGSVFGLTEQGVFRFSQSGGGWRHVRGGAPRFPIPSLHAREATVGSTPAGRPLISNEDRTIFVDPAGGDDSAPGTEAEPLSSVQEAVRQVPIYLRHQYTIDLSTVPELPVTYDEDVLVPTIVATGEAGNEQGAARRGPFLNLIIGGDQGRPGAVRLGSIMFGNVVGTAAANLYQVTVTRDSPYDDEQFGLSAYGDGEVKVFEIAFTSGPTNGIMAYGARMKTSRVEFGSGNLDIGIKGKRHASIIAAEASGELRGDALRATSNSQITLRESQGLSGNPTFNTFRGGLIRDVDGDAWVGFAESSMSVQASEEGAGPRSLTGQADHPDDSGPGDIWYVDGSGEPAEGFYGQTEQDRVRFT